jgi:hypothetical protein
MQPQFSCEHDCPLFYVKSRRLTKIVRHLLKEEQEVKTGKKAATTTTNQVLLRADLIMYRIFIL